MGRLKRTLKWLPVIVVMLAAASWRFGLQHWLAVHTGSSNTAGSPPNYNFWSGSGSDLGEVTLLGIAAGWWRHVNCKARGCPWLGNFPDNRGVKWCWRHHPDHLGQRPTMEFLHRLHHQHKPPESS